MGKTAPVRNSFGSMPVHNLSHGLGDAANGTLHDPARGIARMGAAKAAHAIKVHSGMHSRQVAGMNAGGMGHSTLGGTPGMNPVAAEPTLKKLHPSAPSPVHPGMVSPSRGRATSGHLRAMDRDHADLSSRVFDEAMQKRMEVKRGGNTMAKTTAPRATRPPPLMNFSDTLGPRNSGDVHGRPWRVSGKSVSAGKLPDRCAMEGGRDDYASRRAAGLARIRGS